MCGPALLGAGVGLQFLSNITAGTSARQAARFNARVSENNAELSRRLAGDARRRGRIEEQRTRLEAARVKGRQAAALAAQGVDTSSGSPLQVLGDTASQGALDALQIRANAEREAFQHMLRRSDFTNEASLSRSQGDRALTQGIFRAGGSLLTGASRIF